MNIHFPVKNWISHIFPAAEGLPHQSLFLRYESKRDWGRSRSTPQPCTYLPFMIYTLLTFFLLFPVFDKHFWKSHLPLSCYILFTVKCTSQEDNKVLWLSLCSSNKGTITGGDPTAPKIGSSPLCRCLHPIKKGKRWFQVSIVGIIAAIICF